MKNPLKFLWHGSILVGRVGWILAAGFISLFGPVLAALFAEGKRSDENNNSPYIFPLTDANIGNDTSAGLQKGNQFWTDGKY